jgi:hypothetical protein
MRKSDEEMRMYVMENKGAKGKKNDADKGTNNGTEEEETNGSRRARSQVCRQIGMNQRGK